jgi:hypothetical protein
MILEDALVPPGFANPSPGPHPHHLILPATVNPAMKPRETWFINARRAGALICLLSVILPWATTYVSVAYVPYSQYQTNLLTALQFGFPLPVSIAAWLFVASAILALFSFRLRLVSVAAFIALFLAFWTWQTGREALHQQNMNDPYATGLSYGIAVCAVGILLILSRDIYAESFELVLNRKPTIVDDVL